MPFNPFKKEKTLDELQADTERLKIQAENEDLELTIAQKQALRQKLAENGFTVNKTFGGSIKNAWRWAMSPVGGKKKE